MRTRALKLTETEIAALKQAEDQTSRPNELRRMQAVRLFGSGMAVDQVVEVTGLSERTIQRHASRFRAGGISELRERRKGGNRALLTDGQRGELAEKLHHYRPVDLKISQHHYWTVRDLAVVVEQWYGVVYQSVDSYYDLLHSSGFTLQRSAKVYRHQPGADALAEFETQLEKK
jgi:putative transposase